MKVKCINNMDYEDCLTLNKIYDINYEGQNRYDMFDNFGNECEFNKNRFKKLSEIRNEKIDKLLGE